ncbi:MAG: hypothetical protein MRY64_00440 [Hyphomonadaceae bacterium]|nr:hypothetical protein [Hyphomonadaceae bacterium]
MPRDIDERKKRKALRKLRKAQALAEQGLGPPLSDWEREFLEEVEARIQTYGSAFNDSEKGSRDEPLSALQQVKLKEIDKKARGKGLKRSSFQSRRPSPERAPESEIEDTPPEEAPAPDLTDAPKRGPFRVIEGGKSD